MACTTEWGVILSKLADGEVAPDEKHLAESHVAGCATCRQTLELFTRNEKVLESALAGEAFGDMVVEGVMAEIRRLEMPPIVAPAVDGPSWRARLVRRWPVAAAAAGLLLLLGAVLLTRGPDYGSELAKLQAIVEFLTQQQLEFLHQQEDLARGRDRTYAMLPAGLSIPVRATFADREKFDHFEVQRSEDGCKTWTTIEKSLAEPYYVDKAVREGATYDYRFVGMPKEGSPVTAAPSTMSVPVRGALDPLTSLRITFVGATTDPYRPRATFIIERQVDGKPASQWFIVGLGETLGGAAQGANFSTNLVLDRVELTDEVVSAGPPAATRLNQLARLRATDGATVDIWRGKSRLIPLPQR